MPLIYHSKTNSQNIRCTFFGEVQNNTLYISVARCSQNDQFNKKMGIKIAGGRFNKGKFINVINDVDNFKITNHQLFINACKQLENHLIKSSIFITVK